MLPRIKLFSYVTHLTRVNNTADDKSAENGNNAENISIL